MSKVDPLANFPFKVTMKDGTVDYTSLLSYTHGNIVSLSMKNGFLRVSLDDIDTISLKSK